MPEIEEQLEEHQPLPGRQKASAQLEPVHPPTVIAKLCSTAFKKSTRRILENVRGNYAVPPGTQHEAIISDDLRVGMKRAAEGISRSKFEAYNFATAGATRPKKSWVTRMVIYGPGKFLLVNNDVSRRNDCFKRKETPQNGN